MDLVEKFLQTINLGEYRDRYRAIKIVEMDLPKEIHALELMYKTYWDERKLLNYDEFYEKYLDKYKLDIERFRIKTTMCKDCFYRGLPARIYRTWASIITQIHAGYVAQSVFGPGTVSMSEELDHRGADFQVKYKGKTLNFQVKKKSFSREVRQAKIAKVQIEGDFIDIKYEVPQDDYFKNPNKKDGSYRLPYARFMENKELKRFPNGFVVFTPAAFEKVKKKIDDTSN